MKKLKSIENIHENVGNIQNLEFENNFFDAYVEIVLSGMWESSLKLDSPESLHLTV